MRIMLSAGLSVRDHEFTNRGAARGDGHFQEYRVSLNYLSPHFSRGVERCPGIFKNIDRHAYPWQNIPGMLCV